MSPALTGAPPTAPAAAKNGTALMWERAAATGVAKDDPIVPILLGLAELVEAHEQHAMVFVDGVAQLEHAAEEDRERMRAATEHCRATTLKLEATFGTLQARADNLMTQAIATMAERVADKASDCMVIVERRHNFRVLWRTSVLAALLLVAMIGTGWWLRGYTDRDANTLLAACRTGAVQDRNSGEYYCPYGAVPPG